jgi:hypothetical protein
MRTISKRIVAIIATTVVVGGQSANAGFVGGPHALGLVAKRISFSNFTLPPLALPSFACVMPTSANPSGSCFEAARFLSRQSAGTICEPSIKK